MRTGSSTQLTKNEKLYQILRGEILAHKLLPGQRLVIANLAKQYKVSPMPVREALKRLQQEGLVKVLPHVGAIVKALDFSSYQDIVAVRNQLEAMAAVTASKHITPAIIKKLYSLLERMEKHLETAPQKNIKLDYNFHFTIYNCSPNKFLVENVAMLWERCNISPYILLLDKERSVESHHEHIHLVQLIERQETSLIGEFILRHKERSLEKLRGALGNRRS